ncbi:Putative ribonuclease H protein At1g65750 [Linum perenne]
MRLGMKMGLRDGAETNFWLDRWVDGGERLIDLTSGSSHAIDVDQPVNAFVTSHETGSYQVCPGQEESVLHVLRDYPLAYATWELLALSSGDQTFFQTPLLPWIERFIRKPELCLLFGVTCWWLWRARNDRVFNNKHTTADSLTRHIQVWVALVGETLERDRFITHTGPPTRTEEYISWERAPPVWVTLNSDGSVISESGQAATGGLIRDHQGRCLAAFAMNLGKCSITRAQV